MKQMTTPLAANSLVIEKRIGFVAEGADPEDELRVEADYRSVYEGGVHDSH